MKNFKSTLDIQSVLTWPDWAVFFLVLLATFLMVIYGQVQKKKDMPENESFMDLLLMGRQLTLPMFVATLVATWYGGIFGVTEIAFKNGIYNFVTQGVFWYATYLIFALFLVPKIHQFDAVTLPDLVGKMFGPKSSYVSGVFNLFNIIPVAYTISLGIFIEMVFDIPQFYGCIIGVVLVISYSMIGGLRSVVFSDLIQFFVMCSAVFLILTFSMFTFGGVSFLQHQLPESYFSLLGENSIGTTLVWGFIALSTLVDPNFYQRCFAAKSTHVAKKGIFISTAIWMMFDVCTTAGAMYARAVIPDATPHQSYLIYGLQILPTGLKGFVLAGILATILSTMDSYIFVAGTTLSYDLVPKKWKGKTMFHHLGVCFAGIVSIFMAYSFKGNIKAVWKTLGSYSAACLLFPIMLGYLFPKKISDNQFIFSSILGVIAVTFWRNTSLGPFWGQVDELYAGLFATVVALGSSTGAKKLIQHYS